LLLSCQALS